MIGTKEAAYIALLTVISAVVVGVVAGALTCPLLRRRWGLKTALIDAAITADVMIVLTFLISEVEDVVGVYQSLQTPVFVVTIASVVARHVIPARASRGERL